MSPLSDEQLDLAANEAATMHGLDLGAAIGEGTFKRVYQIENHQNLVLKVFKRPVTERDDREIQICSSGKLCSVPRIHHTGHLEMGRHPFRVTYVIEQRLNGRSLGDHLLSRGSLTSQECIQLQNGLLKAALEIWNCRLVHRDIKPDNIFVKDNDFSSIYLLDLGLARHLDLVSLTASWAPQGPGTPYFASPEQLNNEKAFTDWRSDQFSIAVTICVCAISSHPYQIAEEQIYQRETVARVAERTGQLNDKFCALATGSLSPLYKMAKLWPVERYCSINSITELIK